MSAHAGFFSKCLCQLMLGFYLSAYVSSCRVSVEVPMGIKLRVVQVGVRSKVWVRGLSRTSSSPCSKKNPLPALHYNHTHTHTYTHRHTQAHTGTHRHTCFALQSHTHRHTHRHTYRHTHRHTHASTHTHTQTDTHTGTHSSCALLLHNVIN